jgi:hypothetical protein
MEPNQNQPQRDALLPSYPVSQVFSLLIAIPLDGTPPPGSRLHSPPQLAPTNTPTPGHSSPILYRTIAPHNPREPLHGLRDENQHSRRSPTRIAGVRAMTRRPNITTAYPPASPHTQKLCPRMVAQIESHQSRPRDSLVTTTITRYRAFVRIKPVFSLGKPGFVTLTSANIPT